LSRGGTLLLVKNYLNPTLIETNVQAELCWIYINPHPNVNIVIGSYYRPEVNENIIVDRICTSITKPWALKQRIYNGKKSTWFLITVLADSSLESPVSVSFSQFARFLSASLGCSHVFQQALYGV
jgi:hypothetical protein